MTPYEQGRKAMRALAYHEGDQDEPFEELDDPEFARGVVDELCDLQDKQVPLFREVITGSRQQAADFQVAPMDSLLELIQNADDAGARRLTFTLKEDQLLIVRHDGRPLTLRDVVGISLPNFTTKTDNAEMIGRFGIGLKTVYSLATSICVRDGRYAVKTFKDGIRPWTPFSSGDETEIRLELQEAMSSSELKDWFEQLGGDGLIFTRHLREANVRTSTRLLARSRLKRTRRQRLDLANLDWSVTSERVGFWTVYRASVPVPPGFKRDRKATSESVMVSMAVGPTQARGCLSLGLPTEHRWTAPTSYDAPFDPDATRRTIKENEPNAWLLRAAGQLNTAVVRHRWQNSPDTVWAAIPCAGELQVQRTWLQAKLDKIVGGVTEAALQLEVLATNHVIADSWWPDEVTEDVVTDKDLSLLSGSGILPRAVRGTTGRWREVMTGMSAGRRVAAAALPALVQNDDEILEKPPRWFVEVARLLLNEDEALLDDARVLVDSEGNRHTVEDARNKIVLVTGSPQHRFPVLRRVHDAFLGTHESAVRVREWLRAEAVLVDNPTDGQLLKALAGRSQDAPVPMDDEDLLWLRTALHQLDDQRQNRLARRIGARILLDGFHYARDGSRHTGPVRPSHAYLPSGLDRTAPAFSRAAGRTPGLAWIDRRYDEVLRERREHAGALLPAALSFLQGLGASTLPRLTDAPDVHDHGERSGQRRGHLQAAALTEGDTSATRQVLARTRRRVELQEDRDSPDLLSVAAHIAADDDPDEAHERGQSLFAVLRRAWTNREQPWREQAKVQGRFSYYYWRSLKAAFPARWRSRIADVRWLTDAAGRRSAPRKSSIRTPELQLVEGDADHHIVFDELDESSIELARALGMRLTPKTSQIIERLKELRDKGTDDRVQATANACYQLIASRIPGGVSPHTWVGDVQVMQLRGFFGLDPTRPGLILCKDRWLSPSQVVIGAHGFGSLRGAVADRPEERPLWDALGVQEENARTARKVVEELAAETPKGKEWRSAMVLALRLLASTPRSDRPNVSNLPLWCSDHWVHRRPVYACAHPYIAEQLQDDVPVWTPECDLASLGELPEDLGVTTITVTDSSQVEIEHNATTVEELTRRFREATYHFRSLLEQHEPDLLDTLKVSWQELHEAAVGVSACLTAHVVVDEAEARIDLPLAWDREFGVVLRDGEGFSLKDPGAAEGLLVFFYENSTQKLAPLYRAGLYWAQAWRQAESGEMATPLLLQRVTPDDPPHDEELLLAGNVTGVRQDPPESQSEPQKADPPERKSKLKRPQDIAFIRIHEKAENQRPTADSKPDPPGERSQPGDTQTPIDEAPEPKGARRRVVGGSVYKEDSEELGWRVVEAILSVREDPQVRDLRRRRDVGADGYDPRRDKAVELKAYRGPIPDGIRLQKSQIREARSRRGDFWLFVIGGLAEGHNLDVRLIDDPLRRLVIADQSSLKMEGIRRVSPLARWTEVEDATEESDATK